MDRNVIYCDHTIYRKRVALRKESVDRNLAANPVIAIILASLSARRAWIEISATAWTTGHCLVALRKESVDRNFAVFGAEILT